MKVGIIRCRQTEDTCPASTDFKVIKNKEGAFANIKEDIEIIGLNSCGGCPGKKAVFRAQEMVNRGADTIVLASCIKKGTPINFPCPFGAKMQRTIQEHLGPDIRIIDYTH